MTNEPKIDPQEEPKETPIRNSKGARKKLRVGVYFSSLDELEKCAEGAVKAGYRRGGLPAIKKKPHGWGDEFLVNADGLGPYLRDCWEKRDALDRMKESLKALGVEK